MSSELEKNNLNLGHELAVAKYRNGRLLKLCDLLLEDHAPSKFGPCWCPLCLEYESLRKDVTDENSSA